MSLNKVITILSLMMRRRRRKEREEEKKKLEIVISKAVFFFSYPELHEIIWKITGTEQNDLIHRKTQARH